MHESSGFTASTPQQSRPSASRHVPKLSTDDFDEAYPLRYTNDLVRLAASVKVAIDDEVLAVKLKDACDAILSGYEDCLRCKGRPMVLAENEQRLELLGRDCIRSPNEFWEKLNKRPAVHNGIPRQVRSALEKTFPAKDLDYKLVTREGGLGSLGATEIRRHRQMGRKQYRT